MFNATKKNNTLVSGKGHFEPKRAAVGWNSWFLVPCINVRETKNRGYHQHKTPQEEYEFYLCDGCMRDQV